MDQDDHPNASPVVDFSPPHQADDLMITSKANFIRPIPLGTAKGTWAKAVGRSQTCECGDAGDDEDMVECAGELQ